MLIVLYFISNFLLFSFDINIKKQLVKDAKLYTDTKNSFLVSTLKENSYVYILKEFLNHYYVKTLDNKKGYLAKEVVKDFILKKPIGYLIFSANCDVFADKSLTHKLGTTNLKEKILVESFQEIKDKIIFKTIYGFYILAEKGQYLFKVEKSV